MSHNSRETFVKVSRDSRAIVAQFYFLLIKSPNGLIYVAIYSHLYCIFVTLCGSRKLNCDVSVKDLPLVRDTCDDLAIVLRGFLSHKKVLHV